jgi:hypothetical protein
MPTRGYSTAPASLRRAAAAPARKGHDQLHLLVPGHDGTSIPSGLQFCWCRCPQCWDAVNVRCLCPLCSCVTTRFEFIDRLNEFAFRQGRSSRAS